MIAWLKGTVIAHDGSRAVIDVRDVGYAIQGPASDIEAWVAADGPVEVFVSTDVREDAITLFGFSEDLARVVFERLRLVKGVGPKVALAALDTLGMEGLAQAVSAGDTRKLSSIPGVGKRLAQRLALELEGKLPATFAPTGPGQGLQAPKRGKADMFALAMARLGYTRSEITRARDGLSSEGIGEDTPVADRVKAALRILSGG